MTPKFFLAQVTDTFVRENFKKLQDWFSGDTMSKMGFKFYSLAVPNSTTQTFSHSLGYIPQDVILTAVSAGQSIIFNYDSFTATTISFTASGACTMRFMLGTYQGGAL